MSHLRLILFEFAFFFFITATGQQNRQGIISGIIKDAQTRSPLTEAVITVSSTAFVGQKFALTDSLGMFKVTNLPAGNYTISFEMEGYEKLVRDSITLDNEMNVALSFDMTKGRKKNRKNQVQVTSYK